MWRQLHAEGIGGAVFHRILIVDDSPTIRFCVRQCIEANTACDVCGEAENGKVAVEKVGQLNPDVVILDFHMPVMDGLEAARQIAHIAPNTAMLMLTMHKSDQLVQAANNAGIEDVLSKTDSVSDHLLASLRDIGAEG
jgi:DNA-binding NarL/FixJ family response regulator